MIKNRNKMKVKGIITSLFFVVLASTSAKAQDGAIDDCDKFKSLSYQYLQANAWHDAAAFYGKAIEACGPLELGKDVLSNGRYIFSKLLKEDTTAVRQAEINDTIYKIYEWRMKVVNDPEWTADYAALLISNKSTDFAKIDTLFANSIHNLKEKASHVHIKQYFIHLIVNKFNSAPADKKEDQRTTIIEEYIVFSDYVSTAIKNATAVDDKNEVIRMESARDFLDKYFLLIAKDCDALTNVFATKLKSLPTDVEAKKGKVKDYLALMDQKKCQSSAVYGQFVDTLIILDPTADAYFFGASYALSNDNRSKALKYFEKAVELEGNGANADKYLYSLANVQYRNGNYKVAFSTAKKVQGSEFRGDALVICANSIAATANNCGESTFARKANYWLANDYIVRAIGAGKSGVSSNQFMSAAPSANEAFSDGISVGSSYNLSCWGENTIVRF